MCEQANMHDTTIEETVSNRAANEELFNDLMRLKAMLEMYRITTHQIR